MKRYFQDKIMGIGFLLALVAGGGCTKKSAPDTTADVPDSTSESTNSTTDVAPAAGEPTPPASSPPTTTPADSSIPTVANNETVVYDLSVSTDTQKIQTASNNTVNFQFEGDDATRLVCVKSKVIGASSSEVTDSVSVCYTPQSNVVTHSEAFSKSTILSVDRYVDSGQTDYTYQNTLAVSVTVTD